jgi:hypothetical protein
MRYEVSVIFVEGKEIEFQCLEVDHGPTFVKFTTASYYDPRGNEATLDYTCINNSSIKEMFVKRIR